jgi:hypothetical protein
MRRSFLLLVSAMLAAGLVYATAGAGAAKDPVVKNVNGWVKELAMDGPQVAYATDAFAPTGCRKLFTWNVATGAGVLVSGPKSGTCSDDRPDGQAIVAVAIAGDRLAWIRNLTGNTESDDVLFTATLPGPHEVRLATAIVTGDTDGSALKGDWIGGLTGSGSVLAANTWSTDATGAVTSAALQTVSAHLTRIASGLETRTAESADTGRIAVVRSDGTVAIYSVTGTSLQTIAPPSVREIALRKDYLVVLTDTKKLEIYNSHTGVLIRQWQVPAGATHLDVNSDIAVYSVYRRLYAIQLTTGRQIVLASEKRAIAAAAIEAPGVVYAYNTVRGNKDIGNLVFLPLTRVQADLGPRPG